MKVVAGCSLDNNIMMKNFDFEDGTSEEEIRKTVDEWAYSLFSKWFIICKEEEEDCIYGE